MKIDILRLIEDALIGGRNGEMAYIDNNPFINQLYREWQRSKKSNNTFRDFLLECLSTEQNSCDTQTVTTYKPITKRYDVYDYDEKYKEYKVIQEKINTLQRDMQKILKELAESKNKVLADISTYEVKSDSMGTYLEFKVSVEEITKIEEVKG